MSEFHAWPAGLNAIGMHLSRGAESGSVVALGVECDARILNPWEAGEDRKDRDGTVTVLVNGEETLLARLDAIAGGAHVNLTALAALSGLRGPRAALKAVVEFLGGTYSETHVTVDGVTHAHHEGQVVSLRPVSFLSRSVLGDWQEPGEVPDLWLDVRALLTLGDVPPARAVQAGPGRAVTDGTRVTLSSREWSVTDLRALVAALG